MSPCMEGVSCLGCSLLPFSSSCKSFLRWDTQNCKQSYCCQRTRDFMNWLNGIFCFALNSFPLILCNPNSFSVCFRALWCWTCHRSLLFYLLLFKADRMNTYLHSRKLSEWQTWIFKTLNLLIYVLFRECFRLCPKICGVRFFGLLPLPTVIGYDRNCREKNVVIPWTINLCDNSESSRCGS